MKIYHASRNNSIKLLQRKATLTGKNPVTPLKNLLLCIFLIPIVSCIGYTVKYKSGVLVAPDREYYMLDNSKGIYIYNLPQNKLLTSIGTSSVNSTAMLSPDGSYLAIGSENKIEIFDASSTKVNTIKGNFGKANWFLISPDNLYVLLVNENRKTIDVYGLKSGKLYWSKNWPDAFPPKIIFNSKGDKLIVGGLGEVQVVKFEGLATIETYKWSPSENTGRLVNSIAISSDGRYIAVGNRDFTIRVWNTHTGEMWQALSSYHKSYIIYLEFSPTGKYLFSSDWDGIIGLWDITEGSLVERKGMGGRIFASNNIDFYLDGEIVIYEYDGSQLTQDKWVVYPEYRQLVSNTNLTAKEYVKEGITYFNNKNYIKAEAYFHMAIERGPEYQPAYNWLGFCYAKMGRKQRAIRELTKAIKLAPNTVEADDAKKLIEKLK